MAIYDTGNGTYMDIDTDDQILDLIQDRISYEFAELVRSRISDNNEFVQDLIDKLNHSNMVLENVCDKFSDIGDDAYIIINKLHNDEYSKDDILDELHEFVDHWF